ncbi:MAG: hypothetical protein WA947_02900 [Phormidesmis sp.]
MSDFKDAFSEDFSPEDAARIKAARVDADTEVSTIESIELPPAENAAQEGEWLKVTLHKWLDEEFLPEIVNEHIAARASQVFTRQRMEGENNLNALVLAVLTEMQGYDFSKSFYSEFAIANAVGDLLLESLGIEKCCGNTEQSNS